MADLTVVVETRCPPPEGHQMHTILSHLYHDVLVTEGRFDWASIISIRRDHMRESGRPYSRTSTLHSDFYCVNAKGAASPNLAL